MKTRHNRIAICGQLLVRLGIICLYLSACSPKPATLAALTPSASASPSQILPPTTITASPLPTRSSISTPAHPTAEQAPSTPPTASPTQTAAVEKPGLPAAWASYPEFRAIKGMVFDQVGTLWAVGPDGALQIKPDGTFLRYTTKDGLPSNDLISIGLDAHGVLWFGSRGSGVARFDGKSWQTFTTADGLAGNEVFAIADYPDAGGVLLGTQKGLSVYTGSWGTFAGPGYLPDDQVHAIIVLPRGSIWVGTRKGITEFGRSETFTTADGLAGNEVRAITAAPDCSLWIGTSQGVSHHDGAGWKSYTTVNGLASDEVSAAAATLDGALWFATRSGLSRFDGRNWTTITTRDGLADNDVLSIAVAPDDSLWVGTAGALSHYTPPTAVTSGAPGNIPGGLAGSVGGLQVVYLKDGNLWQWNAESKGILTHAGRVTGLKLFGDGRTAAFTRQNDGLENELWAIDADGGDERLLAGPEQLASLVNLTQSKPAGGDATQVIINQFEWVPGQNALAFDTRRYLEEPGSSWYNDLHQVDVKSGKITTLLPPGRGGMFFYSPDGSQIAIVTPNALSLMDADGSNWRPNLMEYPSVTTYSEAPYYPRPIWSAGSKFLLLALPPTDPLASPAQPTVLWRIPTDGSPAVRLGSINPTGISAFSVAISPDLTHLAYLTEAGEPAENQRQLHIANLDGTGDRIVQEGTSIQFWGWSPDGGHFIYSFGKLESWFAGSLDGDPVPLSIHPESLTWVDRDSFLVVQDLGCSQELRLVNLIGESLVIDRAWNAPLSFGFTRR